MYAHIVKKQLQDMIGSLDFKEFVKNLFLLAPFSGH